MKKLIAIPLFLAFIVLSNAQSIGLRSGLNLANYKFNTDSLTNAGFAQEKLNGIILSLPIEIKVAKNFYIQTELGFLQKGYKSVKNVSSGTSSIGTEFKNYTNYVDLPLLLKFKTGGNRVNIFAVLGPNISYAMSSKTKQTNGDNTTTQTISLEGTKRLDYGLNAGAGIAVNIGFGSIVLDGRYLQGIQNLKTDVANLKNQIGKTQGLATTLGFFINL